MQDLRSNASDSRLGRRGALVAALAIVLLGTAGFAAAGGVEMVRGWFVTVEVNGVPVDVDDANIDIQTDGEMATITIDGLEVPEGDFEEGQVVTVTATATSAKGGGTVIVKEVSGDDKDK